MKITEKTIIVGGMNLSTTTSEKINKFAQDNNINVTELNPFAPEPILITDPYRKFREEIINTKYYEKSKSKYHK